MPGRVRFAIDRMIALHSAPVWNGTKQEWRRRFDPGHLLRALLEQGRFLISGARKHVYRMEAARPPASGRRPRILHLIPNIYVGGSTQLICDLCQGLGDRFDMEIVTAARPRNAVHTGIRIHDHPMPGDRERLTSLIRGLSPGLLHIHYWGSVDTPWYEAAFGAAESLGLPVLQNVNTPVTAYRSAAVVETIFVSNTVRALTTGTTGRTIYPGIDFARFSPPRVFAERALDSVGMVYRLERDKLNDDSILPLIELARRRPRTRILIVGEGSLLPGYLQQVQRGKVQDNFWFAGSVPFHTLPDWYSQFRTFVAPVWQESFGQVTPFAMAMGLAVAGYKVGALPEILQSDELLSDSAHGLCSILHDLLDRPDRIQDIGQNNLRIARQRFSLDEMIARYDDLYCALFGLRSRGAVRPPCVDREGAQ